LTCHKIYKEDESTTFKQISTPGLFFLLRIPFLYKLSESMALPPGTGTGFYSGKHWYPVCGDSIEKFGAGEFVLLGKNLPHLWLDDKE
jgi:hypothetical protein